MGLLFEERKGVISGAKNNCKLYIKRGISEKDCLEDLEEEWAVAKELHKTFCDGSEECVFDETFELIKTSIHEAYSERTILDEDEILRLAKEKLGE